MKRFCGKNSLILPVLLKVLSIYSCAFCLEEHAQEFLKRGELKEVILALQQESSAANADQKCDLGVSLAVAYLRDQNQEKAFEHYLKALQGPMRTNPYQRSDAEEESYKKGLEIYLAFSAKPSETAKLLLEHLSETAAAHPGFAHVGFLMASAHANLSQFEPFFHTFYRSYRIDPDHYLVEKTQAILHIKLLEKTRAQEEREKHRLAVENHLWRAVDKYPHDLSLYKLILLFSEDQGKIKNVEACLNKMIDQDIKIPRADLLFYVAEALNCQHRELAKRFVDKARGWYPHSRLLDEAQEYIDQSEAYHDE